MIRPARKTGFTIVELLIVIIVLAILAGVVIVAFNGLTRRAQVTDLTTTMTAISKAMEADKAFNMGSYPTDLPSNTDISPNINVSYSGGDSGTYCIDGVHKADSNLKMFITQESKDPKYGDCSSGEDTAYNPYTSSHGAPVELWGAT